MGGPKGKTPYIGVFWKPKKGRGPLGGPTKNARLFPCKGSKALTPVGGQTTFGFLRTVKGIFGWAWVS